MPPAVDASLSRAPTDTLPRPVFTYGSLMADAVFDQVVGSSVSGRPRKVDKALLAGHIRYGLKGEPYPAMVPAPATDTTSAVEGVLWFLSTNDQVRALDAFETDMYKRVTVTVQVAESWGTRHVEADVYLWNGDASLLQGTWDYDDFLVNRLPRWMQEGIPAGELCGIAAAGMIVSLGATQQTLAAE